MIKKMVLTLALVALGSAGAMALPAGVSVSKDKMTVAVSHGSSQYTTARPPKKGTTIFSNIADLYPKSLYFCCYGDTISGPTSALGAAYSAALEFTPDSDATATELDASVGYVEGTNAMDLVIYADAGGVPGKELVRGKATGLGVFGSCCGLAVAKIKKTKLSAGTVYWVAAEADTDAQDFFGAWSFNTVDEIDAINAAYNSGSGYQSGGGAIPAPAFAVIGK